LINALGLVEPQGVKRKPRQPENDAAKAGNPSDRCQAARGSRAPSLAEQPPSGSRHHQRLPK